MALFEQFLAVIDALLGPNGCPWDKKQSLKDLRACILEESHEVVEAIDTGNYLNLNEELGDLLINIILCIHKAPTAITLETVLTGAISKLKDRHPHVFGDSTKQLSPIEAQDQWDAIKAQEDSKEPKGLCSGIPSALPSLMKAYKLSKRLEKVGIIWNISESILNRGFAIWNFNRFSVPSERAIGILLWLVALLARRDKIDPEIALNDFLNNIKIQIVEAEKNIIGQPLTDKISKECSDLIKFAVCPELKDLAKNNTQE